MYVIYSHPHELTEQEKKDAICIPQREIHFHLFRNLIPDIMRNSCKLPPPEKRNIYSNALSFLLKLRG